MHFLLLIDPLQWVVAGMVGMWASPSEWFPSVVSLKTWQPVRHAESQGSSPTSVLPMNIQGWFPLGLISLISLQFKGLSRVFSSTTIGKHPFFGAQPSLWSNSHIRTWLREKPYLWLYRVFVGRVMSLRFNMLSRFVIAFLPRRKDSWDHLFQLFVKPINCFVPQLKSLQWDLQRGYRLWRWGSRHRRVEKVVAWRCCGWVEWCIKRNEARACERNMELPEPQDTFFLMQNSIKHPVHRTGVLVIPFHSLEKTAFPLTLIENKYPNSIISWGKSLFIDVSAIISFVAVQSLSRVQLLGPHGLQHARLLCPPLSPRVCSNSCPLSRWRRATLSSSVAPFCSRLQSFPASGSFPVSPLFEAQSTGASESALPVNIQGWFPFTWLPWWLRR